MKTFYVTTPIYYVNDRPHIGHAYATVVADVLARYHRLAGHDVHFLTGTDEHGQKVQDAAAKRGVTPQAHCDEMVLHFRRLWDRLGIEPSDFIRTTEERHVRVVQEVLSRLHREGKIYKGSYEGWYCVHEENFWTEKDLVEGRCPDCRRPVVRVTEENWFFRLSEYRDWLLDRYRSDEASVVPPSRRNEVLGFLQKDLGDLCISRPKSRLAWGIPLPFDPDYVTYVWFDALLNYVSAIGFPDDAARFGRWWPSAVHLVGKDILIPSHSVYWPAMLKAAGVAPPRTIVAHGWWLVEDAKISKSLGNAVDPLAYIESHGADAVRYFLVREMTLGQDRSFTDDLFRRRYEADLANAFGNLVSRSIAMTEKYFEGRVPEPAPGAATPEDDRYRALSHEVTREELERHLDAFQPNALLDRIWETTVRPTNAYIDASAPWVLAKKNERARLEVVLRNVLDGVARAATLLGPVMPETTRKVREALNFSSTDGDPWKGAPVPGTRVSRVGALFPRQVDSEREP